MLPKLDSLLIGWDILATVSFRENNIYEADIYEFDRSKSGMTNFLI